MDERNELDLQAELLSFHEAERFPSVSLDSSDCSVTFSLHFQRLGKSLAPVGLEPVGLQDLLKLGAQTT